MNHRIENEKCKFEDLENCIDIFYTLNKHFGCEQNNVSSWVRMVHEINSDYNIRMKDFANEMLKSFQQVEWNYGQRIAKQIFESDLVLLSNEIEETGKYLWLGGDISNVQELVKDDEFLESRSIDEMKNFIETYNQRTSGMTSQSM